MADKRKFTCEGCGASIVSKRTDEEIDAEMKADFGELQESERAVVCEDCYNDLMETMKTQH